MLAIRLNAGNDLNGNPRRCYVLMQDDGSIGAVVDEGYSGWRAMQDAGFDNIILGPTFPTTVTEYRCLLREFPNSRIDMVSGGFSTYTDNQV